MTIELFGSQKKKKRMRKGNKEGKNKRRENERKRERIHVNAVVKIYMSQRPTLSFISLAPSIIFIETVVSVVWNLPLG